MRDAFLEKLAQAPSNLGEVGYGAKISEPLRGNPRLWTCWRLLRTMPSRPCFSSPGMATSPAPMPSSPSKNVRLESGKAHVALGAIRIRSRITRKQRDVFFGVLHFGDHNVMAGVRVYPGETEFDAIVAEVREPFQTADLPATVRSLDRHFGDAPYTIKSLFRDEQRRIVREILRSTLTEAETSYRHIYEGNALFLRFLADLGAPEPKILHITAEFVINSALRRAFEADTVDTELVRGLLDSARRERINLDATALAYRVKRRLAALADALAASPSTSEVLDHFEAAVNLIPDLPFTVDLWQPQNVVFDLLCRKCPSGEGQPIPEEVQARLSALTETLQIRCNQEAEKPSTPEDVAVAV